MSIVRIGATKQYSDNWDTIFGGGTRRSAKTTPAKQKSNKSAKRKPAKKKAPTKAVKKKSRRK
jgi:hypothetical protein